MIEEGRSDDKMNYIITFVYLDRDLTSEDYKPPKTLENLT